ncbi:MAG: ribosome maturation factor RimP [Cytophagales bacterium]
MMQLSEDQIRKWVEELIADPSLFVVEIEIKGDKGGKKKIAIYLDGDKGISIDACSKISKKLGAKMEEEDSAMLQYNLEVSSFGVGKPLKMLRQYKNNIGRKVRIDLGEGKSQEGILKEVSDNALVLEKKKKKEVQRLNFELDKINSIQVLVSFK